MRLSGPPANTFWVELSVMLAAVLAIGFLLYIGHAALDYFHTGDYPLLHINPPPEL